MQVNIKFFDEIWEEVSELLQQKGTCNIVDVYMLSLFTNSLKELNMLSRVIGESSKKCNLKFMKSKIYHSIRLALMTDYKKYPIEVINSLPDYKIAIDWMMRQNSILDYIIQLLVFASTQDLQNLNKMVHIAGGRGISGPWANLDLPINERIFSWREIEDEVMGRERSKERQRRYRKGFENYNNDGRVGEGYYWREMRNEPYSWYDRSTESPYPSRATTAVP